MANRQLHFKTVVLPELQETITVKHLFQQCGTARGTCKPFFFTTYGNSL